MLKEIITTYDSNMSLHFLVEENDDHITLARYLSDEVKNVVIPTYIDKLPVTSIGDNCFFDHGEITQITLPPTLESIGNQAFALCKGISVLDLPDQIKEIGSFAFRDCKGLKKVKLPAKLKRLRTGVFSFCYLSEGAQIIVPDGLEVIEKGAFWSAGNFELNLPESVKEIGVGAFNWGPRVITSLPFDKGWYQSWPYGEELINCTGEKSLISDVEVIPSGEGCLLLTLNSEDSSKKVFYPFLNDEYRFSDEENQKRMLDELLHTPNAKKIYTAWKRGLI